MTYHLPVPNFTLLEPFSVRVDFCTFQFSAFIFDDEFATMVASFAPPRFISSSLELDNVMVALTVLSESISASLEPLAVNIKSVQSIDFADTSLDADSVSEKFLALTPCTSKSLEPPNTAERLSHSITPFTSNSDEPDEANTTSL